MIGGILGGSSSMRLGEALRCADVEGMKGRRVVVVSGGPEILPVGGQVPVILAPGCEGTRDVDIVAEFYEAERGCASAAALFANAAACGIGNEYHFDSNSAFWFESMRRGLENLFQAAGYIAMEEGRSRSLVRILCDCVKGLAGTKGKENANALYWMNFLPEEIKGELSTNYTGAGSSNMVASHISTISATVAGLRSTAPEKWTEPFVASPGGDPLFIHGPSWGDAAFYGLLHVALQAGAFFLFPELHRWTERDRRRAGYFLKCESSRADAVWTSLTAPSSSGFESGWEIYGRSSDRTVLRFFEETLLKTGGTGEFRLKELEFETPVSLDEGHVIVRSPAGWRSQECSLFSTAGLVPLRKEGALRPRGGALEENLAEMAARMGKSSRLDVSAEKENFLFRIIEAVPEFCGKKGELFFYMMNSEKIMVETESRLTRREHLAVVGGLPGRPGALFALYEKLWEAVVPPECEPLRPGVDVFLPLVAGLNAPLPPENGYLEFYCPLLGRHVLLAVHGMESISLGENPVAYGTWLEPRRIFLVRSLLRSVVPPRGDGPEVMYPEKDEASSLRLSEEAKDVMDEGRTLYGLCRGLLEEAGKRGELSAVRNRRKELEEKRECLEVMASSMMTSLLKSGPLGTMPERGGFRRADLRALGSLDTPSDLFSMVDAGGLPPAGYRETLMGEIGRVEFTRAFDLVCALHLLNTGVTAVRESPF